MMMGVLAIVGHTQENEEKAIKEVITSFAKAGDKNDVEKLATFLDANYRIVMNRQFGGNGVSITDRDTYLEKIKSKEWGGGHREITISKTVINGVSASVLVVFKGSKISFTSLILLVKNSEGNWLLISDTPIVS